MFSIFSLQSRQNTLQPQNGPDNTSDADPGSTRFFCLGRGWITIVALVKNQSGKLFVNAVEEDKTELFDMYLIDQKSEIIMWLDKEL